MVGKTLAHYEIKSLLGKGGMGEVYRAQDTKLGREVAIKVLPTELSGDPERAARFDREARTLASLQHPNVASIYGFEEVDGIRFLVMELIEGSDLHGRIADGKLPIDETLKIARQIATGLEVAHERGIVHRDLKPANIMLNDAGEAKILDFGLARAWFGDANDEADMATSPTITAAMTQAGTILGTAAYMSPEQARGKNVDRRSDIWAFGAILWEMVTGQRLFEGETISDTLAAVLRAEPDWDLLPVEEAPHLCRLIERCLVRDPQQRLRDIGEARILLQDGGSETSLLSLSSMAAATLPEDQASPSGIRWPVVAAISVLALVVGAVAGWKLLGASPEALLLHTMIPEPAGVKFDMGGVSPGPATLSPDGRMVAFTAMGEDNTSYLYLRHLDRGEAVRISGTEDATYPFWSPGSDFVAFFTVNDEKLRKIAISGGPPVTLCPADNGKGGSWNGNGDIIFAPAADEAIHRVPSIGGEPEPITELLEGDNSHRHPRFLPSGRDFLFLARLDESYMIRMGSLDGGEPVDITESECQAEFAAGHLFTAREGVLFATAFDPDAGALTGGSTPLVEQLLTAGREAAAGSYSVLPSGMMVFQTGFAQTEDVLSWGDLETNATTQIGLTGQMAHPRISPDGERCFVEVQGESEQGIDLWLVDLQTGLRTRFTFEEGDEIKPCWTPDGTTVVYTSLREGLSRIMKQPVDGSGGAETLYEDSEYLATSSVHPDGSRVLFTHEVSDSTDRRMEVLSLDGSGEPEIVPLSERAYGGRYSPDGRWITYGRETAAGWDVFVMSATGAPRKWQITTTGSAWPQWQADGSRLFVHGYTGEIVAYEVESTGNSFRFGRGKELMTVDQGGAMGTPVTFHPDGKRIVHTGPDPRNDQSDVSPIHLVTDWRRGLAR